MKGSVTSQPPRLFSVEVVRRVREESRSRLWQSSAIIAFRNRDWADGAPDLLTTHLTPNILFVREHIVGETHLRSEKHS